MKTKMAKKPGRVKAAVLDWLGVDISLTDGDFWADWSGDRSASGQNITEKSMLSLSAVWGCARLISETIATLPLSIYERTSAGKRVAKEHQLQFLIHDMPNADSTAAVFWEAVIVGMLLRGNARIEKNYQNGKITSLLFLYPGRLSISKLANGKKEYRYRNPDGTQRTIPNDRIWTIPGFSLDGICGVSVIQYGAQVFGAAQAGDEAASKVFANGLLSTIYFKMERILTKEQRAEFRENLVGITGSINAGKSPLLEGGMSADTISIDPKDAQLLESRAFSVEEICRWFRVPPFMVGHSEKSTSWGSGIEQQMIGFLVFTLGPWLRRIEQAIVKDLIAPSERARFYPKFAVEGLLRADTAARSAFYAAMVNNGILTRDEVRELEDREPMGGNAAVLTVQSAMTSLDSIGQATDANQAKAAMRASLGFDVPTKD